MRKSYHTLLCCSAVFLFTGISKISAQAGLPDASFGNNGMVITNTGIFNDVNSIVVQPDGKILAGGYTNTGSEDFSVLRYNSNGSLDTAFGTGGLAVASFGFAADQANEVLLQPDGKIVLAGYAFGGSNNPDFAVARFLPNGDLDTAFGTQGKATIDLTGNSDYGFAAGLQADGKIVIAGPATGGVNGDVGIVRYNTNGTIDNTFGSNGIVMSNVGGDYDCAHSLVIQPDGKIVTAGYSYIGTSYDFSLARFNTNGTADVSFGIAGKVLTPVGPTEDICIAITLQTDGKIVAVGYEWDSAFTNIDYALVRYNTDGSLDQSFGTNGKVMGPISNTHDYLRAVAIQADGKIVASGQTNNPGFTDMVLARFNANGTLDTSFNGTGLVIADVNGEQDYAVAIAIQSDRKILIAGGTVNPPASDVDAVIIRYLGDLELGTVDFTGWNNSVFIYPNPVTENTMLSYSLAEAEAISIRVYDMQGKLISVLQENNAETAGEHQVLLHLPQDLSPGTYFVELSSAQGKISVKIVK